MANNKSARKRIKINRRNQIQNNSYKSLMKTSQKKHFKLIGQYRDNVDPKIRSLIEKSLALATSQIDKAAKRKVIHKNTAARKKSNLYKNTFIVLK